MFQQFNHRGGHYALLLAASGCLFLVNLGGPALWDIDEGRNFTAALEMLESGNWVVPTFNGQLRSHKPALLYWLQVASFQLCGINEFAGRLPSALAAVLTVISVYELGRRMFGASTGLIGGLVLASSTLFSASAHFANPDALLLTFTTATLLLFWLGFASGQRGWIVASGLTAGLAMLAKGPVGVVLPAGVIGLFLIWTGRWRYLFDSSWIKALSLCALVALPWYVMVAIDTKRAFLSEFFLTHHLDRALNAMEHHSGPPWYYLVVVAVGLVPWSAFLGSAVWYGVQSTRRGTDNAEAAAIESYRFLWCWVAVYLLAFTVAATKLPSYILPVFPPCALLIARFLERWRCGTLQVPHWLQPLSLAIMALVGVATIVGLLVAGGTIPVDRLHGRVWPGLEPWSALGVIPLLGAGVGAWMLAQQWRTGFVAVMLVAALAFLAPLAAGGATALNHFRAPRPLVEEAGALQRHADIRIGCYQLEFLPSLNFYVQRNVKHHESGQDALAFLCQPHTVFLFLPRSEWNLLAPMAQTPHRVVAAHREMYRGGEVVVVTNH